MVLFSAGISKRREKNVTRKAIKCKFSGSSKIKSIKKTINFVKDMRMMKIARSSGGRGGDEGYVI